MIESPIRRMTTCTILAILIFIPLTLFPQNREFPAGGDYYFDKLNREDGLSHPSISAIVQDEKGFLWIGTQDGLNRYDGREFMIFEHRPFIQDGLPNNQIQSLFAGRDNTLWIGTYGGLSHFDIDTLTFTNYVNDPENPQSLLGSIVTAVTESGDDVWIGTLGGLCRLNEKEGTFTRYVHSEEDPGTLSDNNVRSLHYDGKDRLWIGTNKGLSLFHPARGDREFMNWPMGDEGPESTEAKAVMSIGETPEGELALGLWNGGVLLFDRDSLSVTRRFVLPDNRVYFIYPDGTDIWVGLWGGGLYHIDGMTSEYTYLNGSNGSGDLTGDIIYSFCKDQNGTYWIGTKSDGLFKLNPDKKKALIYSYDSSNPDSIGEGEITEMLFHGGNELWLGTYSNGLYRHRGNGNDFAHYGTEEDYPFTLDVNRVSMLYSDNRGRLWLGSTEGLFLYNGENNSFEPVLYDGRHSREDQDIVYSMAEDQRGNYWIGTYNRGVIVRDGNWENPRYYDNSPGGGLSDNLIADMICDSEGDMWLASNGGVYRYLEEKDRFARYHYNRDNPRGINTDHVRHIYEDSHRRLWVGTSEGGLNLLEREIGTPPRTEDPSEEGWIKYTKEDGLPHNRIMKILEDGRGNLWISTSYGLAIYSREESTFTAIPQEEGLFSPAFSSGAALDSRGNLYFGSGEGVNLFSLESQYGNEKAPRVVLTDVQVERKSLKKNGTIYNGMSFTLDYEESSLDIRYSALDLLSSGNNRFAYMLEGQDKDWNYVGDETAAVYNNLPPGKYIFRVKGANSAGKWSSEDALLYLTVKQPVWRSPLAILAYVITVAVFAVLLFLSILHRFSLHKIKELEEMKKRLEEANNQLTILSGQDGLTGVNNRRQFDKAIVDFWDAAQRTEQPLAFLMIDIDHFKAYNDSYGHQQGDDCLKTLALLFQKALPRSTDRVYRYGGEEFCLLLPSTDEEGAHLVAKRIHHMLKKEKILHRASPLSPLVTLSIGLAVTNSAEEEELFSFIKRADQNCYRAKEKGRNRTCPEDKAE